MKRRLFCVDVEARPGPWGGGDFTFRKMLSIAGGFDDEPGVVHYLAPGFTAGELAEFVDRMYTPATIMVAHNGPRYDWPFLNGTCVTMGLPPLKPITISDTYAHLPKKGQAFSASLGNMAKRFGVSAKGSMSESGWERAYAGEPAALAKLREYNIGDVVTTLELRRVLVERGLLEPPRTWKPMRGRRKAGQVLCKASAVAR